MLGQPLEVLLGLVDNQLLAHFKMLGAQRKSKTKKRSRGFTGVTLGSVRDARNRVVMFCEDIPSEGSSWDSGHGSHRSGARSTSDGLGQTWRSHSLDGRERESVNSSSRPTMQYYVREIRHESSPIYGQTVDPSAFSIRDQYDSALLLLCTCIVFAYRTL